MVPTQSPVQRVPSTFAPRVQWLRHVLTTHLNQVLMLQQSGAIPLSPLYAYMVLYTDLTYTYSHVTTMYTTIMVMMVVYICINLM